MTDTITLSAWEVFVIENGWKARGYELAAVVGQPVEAILRLRDTGACSQFSKPKGFAELFALWHGRDPQEDDWPAPRKMKTRGGTYEWQPPEVALLASLVGVISQLAISEVLSERLRQKTGDQDAERTPNAVQVRTNQIGLQTSDVVGGLTISEAARDIRSFSIVQNAVEKGELATRRLGRLHVIDYVAWETWKSKRVFPPPDYVRLSSLREPLGIKSDKLPEFAGMGLIPTAIRCNPYGAKGPSTQFGTWWISSATAAQLIADRRAGREMPWHGKYTNNLRTTYKLWEKRKHPTACETCAEIWGKQGVPFTFEDYSARYPDLAHGAKRHLTRPWSPGLTLDEVATKADRTVEEVRKAVENGVLTATILDAVQYVSRTDATRWIARKCPDGESARSWISLKTASDYYLFTVRELRRFIDAEELKIKTARVAGGSVEYVLRQQCAELREKIGFTEDQAARRLGITVDRFKRLLEGVDWRSAEKIPLVTIQAVRKRLESKHGYAISEAAAAIGESEAWVNEQLDRGVARVSRATWDRRRRYLTEPMLQRLRAAAAQPADAEKLGPEWLSPGEAAIEAGVSQTTLNAWATKCELAFREYKGVRHYHREAVRARARTYWQTVRFHRAMLPAWLQRSTEKGSST